MIALILFSLAVIAYRLKKRLFTREEALILAIIVVAVVVTAVQSLSQGNFKRLRLPEMRYWYQATAPLLGWTVWALTRLRYRALASKAALIGVVAVLLAIDFAMLLKPHLPFARRYAHVEACNWAAEIIKTDWRGAVADKTNYYSDHEYNLPNRPCVYAHSARLSYLVNGRLEDMPHFAKRDLPDYICDEAGEESLESYLPTRYELIGEKTFGKRKFVLYRRH